MFLAFLEMEHFVYVALSSMIARSGNFLSHFDTFNHWFVLFKTVILFLHQL